MSFSSFPRSRPVSVSSMVYRTLRSKLLLQQQQQPASAIVAAAAAAANAGSNSNGRNRNKNWNHRCLSTYYDSQSGLHLPVHDEREIRLFLNVTNGYAAAAAPDDNGNSNIDGGEEPTTIHKHRHKPPLVPHRLSKDRLEAEELQETLYRLVQKGIHGVILPPVRFPRDVRNLQTLSAIAPPEFVFITNSDSNSDSSGSCSGETNSDSDPDQNSNSNSNSTTVDDAIVKASSSSSSSSSYSEKPTAATFSRVLRYNHHHQTANGVQLSLRESLQDSVRKGVHTTLAVDEDAYGSNGNNNNDDDDRPEPITLANNIAALIDAGGGCDYLWISSKSKQQQRSSDTMVEVCEELMYLDVAGATIKSRLLVDSVNEDMLEDILFAGVNKYVIGDESEAEMVEAAAEEQGKKLLRS